jgi:hypothetical protein
MSNTDWIMAEQVKSLLIEASSTRGQLHLAHVPPAAGLLSAARVYSDAPIVVASGGTWKDIPFSATRYDTGNWFNPAVNTDLVAPASGLLRARGCVHYPGAAGGDRRLGLWVDGAFVDIDIQTGDAMHDTTLRVSAEMMVTAGQVIRLRTFQSSNTVLALRLYPAYSPELSVSVSL